MKSRIRSRWHRANEKPLEKNGSTVEVAPVGEIDPNHLANLTDDLSNFKPAQSSDERPKRTERGNDHKKGRSRSGKRRPDDRHNERKSRSNEGNQTEQREIQPKLRKIIREDQEREEIIRASKLPGIQKIQTKDRKVLASPTKKHLIKLQALKAFLANFLDRKIILFSFLKIISQ